MEYKCDKCGSENIQPLKIIYENSIAYVNTSSTTVTAKGDVAYTKTSGTHTATIAKKAEPPKEKGGIITSIVSIVIVTPIYLVTLFAAHHHISRIIFFTLIYFFFSFFCLSLGFEGAKFNKYEYPRIFQQWLKSWMCHRCGSIFVIDD